MESLKLSRGEGNEEQERKKALLLSYSSAVMPPFSFSQVKHAHIRP